MFETANKVGCSCRICRINGTLHLSEKERAQREFIMSQLTQQNPSERKKDPAPFWLVWRDGGGPPTRKHDSEASAAQEALRLAKLHPTETFYVLRSISETTTQISFHVTEH